MDWHDFINRFQFYDHCIVNQKVESVSNIESPAFVFDRKFKLSCKLNSALLKFICEALFIHRFEKSGTERTMNLDCSSNDPFGQLLVYVPLLSQHHSCFLCVLCASVLSHRFQYAATSSIALPMRSASGRYSSSIL